MPFTKSDLLSMGDLVEQGSREKDPRRTSSPLVYKQAGRDYLRSLGLSSGEKSTTAGVGFVTAMKTRFPIRRRSAHGGDWVSLCNVLDRGLVWLNVLTGVEVGLSAEDLQAVDWETIVATRPDPSDVGPGTLPALVGAGKPMRRRIFYGRDRSRDSWIMLGRRNCGDREIPCFRWIETGREFFASALDYIAIDWEIVADPDDSESESTTDE